jgi:hypothetical protein
MELFIPSLLVLLLAGIVVFGILPRLAPFALVIVTVLMLTVVAVHHRSLFAGEYATSTWQSTLQAYTQPFLIAMVVLFMFGWLLNLLRGGSTVQPLGLTAPSVSSNLNTAQIRSLIRNP